MNLGFRINRALTCASILAALVAAPCASAAVDVAGIKFEDTAKVGNQDLKLNGAGVRYKAIFKVYAAGLYLSEKKTTVPDILAAPGAKRLQLVMLRDVGNEEFGRSFMEGIQKNSEKAERAKLINQLLKFGELFASIPEIKKGDVLTTDWIPGSGTVLQLNGKKISDVIPDQLFYTVFLKIWLGEKPPDAKLKRLLTGEKQDEPAKSNY